MRALGLVATLLMTTAARSQDLMELLASGPVAMIQSNGQGKFDRATAVIDIKGTPDEVWKSAVDFANYRYFMPKVVKSETTPLGANAFDVIFEVNVPLKNAKYTLRYTLKPAEKTIHGEWQKGDLKGTFCDWRLVPSPGGTLVYYTTAVRGLSSLATAFEDDQQTLTVGVNTVTALAVVKAVKRRVEMTAAAR